MGRRWRRGRLLASEKNERESTKDLTPFTEYHLYNYNARLYDPVVGRFITPDTIVSDPYNPQSLNRYAYCLNNPLIYTDPTGHYFWESFINWFIQQFQQEAQKNDTPSSSNNEDTIVNVLNKMT
jgi:RHS repeat-associated protein